MTPISASLVQKCGHCLMAAMLTAALFAGQALAAQSPEPILVFGHKNPDTDSIVGAIAAAHLLTAQGKPATAMAQGQPNPETQFVLKKFNMAMPAQLEPVTGKPVGIVDFNDAAQGPDDLNDATLVFMADHHKLGGLKTSAPLEAWLLPLGSSNTALYEMMMFYNVAIPKDLAGAMLCAILSDTLMYQSVTTTSRDKTAGAALAKIAQIKDQKALAYDLFKAKSAIEGVSARDLVLRDYKKFETSGMAVGVGQIEVLSLSMLDGKKEGLLEAMRQIKKESNLHCILLMLTDISKQGTEMLAVSDDPSLPSTAFSSTFKDSSAWLPGVMSRKKQVIPPMEKALKK